MNNRKALLCGAAHIFKPKDTGGKSAKVTLYVNQSISRMAKETRKAVLQLSVQELTN